MEFIQISDYELALLVRPCAAYAFDRSHKTSDQFSSPEINECPRDWLAISVTNRAAERGCLTHLDVDAFATRA
jgi:hypothetical protein